MIDSFVGDTATRTSLMVDGRALIRMRSECGIDHKSELHIPLPAASKQLLGNFDAECNSVSVPVLSSMDNAHASVGVLLVWLLNAGVEDVIQPYTVDLLYKVTSCKRGDDFYHTAKSIIGNSPSSDLDAESDGEADDLWDILIPLEETRGAVETAQFCQILDDFLENFISVGVLEPPRAIEFIVKTYTVSTSAEMVPDGSTFVSVSSRQDRRRAPIGFFVTVGVSMLVIEPMAALPGFLLVVLAYYLDSFVRFLQEGMENFNREMGAIAYNLYLRIFYRWSSLQLSGCFRIESANTNLGLYGSQHYRLSIPDGARALDASIRIEGGDGEFRAAEKQVVENWVAAHFTNMQPQTASTMSLSVLVLPRSQSLLKHSFFAALVMATLLGAGLTSHVVGWALDLFVDQHSGDFGLAHLAMRSSGSIVTIIMIAPSIYTFILLRQNEHKFVSRLLRTMRNVVGVSAVVSASVAIPVGLDLPTALVTAWWTVGFLAAVYSCWHVAATRYYHGVLATHTW